MSEQTTYDKYQEHINTERNDKRSGQVRELINLFLEIDSPTPMSIKQRVFVAWWAFKHGYTVVNKLRKEYAYMNPNPVGAERMKELATYGNENK